MLPLKWELINFCEFDKYASQSYCAIHNVDESLNLGDITKVNEKEIADFDLMTWGFPCTDISTAGKQEGFIDENGNKTRSGMYYEGIRILKEKKPKISIIENVKNLTGKKFKKEFETVLNDLNECGYRSYWKILNAKHYGVPQNRERVFIVSIRKDINNWKFRFPQGFDNGIRLKDILEDEVDEKYYISQEKTEKLILQIKQNNPHKDRVTMEADGVYTNQSLKFTRPPLPGISRSLKASIHDAAVIISIDKSCNNPKPIEIANCITSRENKGISNRKGEGTAVLQIGNTVGGGGLEPKIIEDFYANREPREYTENSPTIRAERQGLKVAHNYRIRKLTPKECFRLMGFSDEDIEKAQSVGISNSQLYKQAGNSIVVDVLYYIFKELNKAIPEVFEDLKVSSFFSGIGAFEKALDRLYNDIDKE